MERNLHTMETIMKEKDLDIARAQQPPLDAEGQKLSETKRFTFDIVETPLDPLR